MRRFSCIVGSVFLAMTQAQAELVINGSTISSNATVPVTNSDTYTPNNNFQSCLANLRSQAIAAGVSGSTYDRYTQNLTPDYSVIDKLNYQPEFSTPIWDYLSGLVDEERVALGKQKLAQHRDVLNRASQVYGVPAETIVAVWGVESNFGDISGKYPLLQALGTLSCEGRDLVSSTADALASTANFLNKAGWQTGMPWGFEVQIPAGMSIDGEGRRSKKPLSSWSARGVTRIDGSPLIQGPLSGSTPAGLMAPAGPSGPVFLVFKNFDAIYSYNAAESYGLAIAHLSDRLRGAGPFVSSWPTDDPGTSRAERREIQQFLINRGYDIGAVDGLIGDKTRVAIRQEQTRLGLNPTGRAGQQILRAFRQEQARKMMQ